MKERPYLTFIYYLENLSEYLIYSHDPPHSGDRMSLLGLEVFLE